MATYLPAPGSQAPLLPAGKLELKYLFAAKFKNGAVYQQTPEDVSQQDPDRPANYDLLECEEDGTPKQHPYITERLLYRNDIALFVMQASDTLRFLVDLSDGHFETQHFDEQANEWIGQHFFIQMPSPNGGSLRAIYFKRKRHHANMTATVLEDGRSVGLSDLISASQECEYHFGWIQKDRMCTLILV